MLFKKVETNVLEVMVTYGCGIFLTYVVGNVAYNVGKQVGKERERLRRNKKVDESQL